MDIQLGKQTRVVTQEEKFIDIETVTVQRIVFLPNEMKLRVFTVELPNAIETTIDPRNPDLAIVIAAIENIVRTALG